MADLFWLSDEQWAVLEPFMPKNQPGARRVEWSRRTVGGPMPDVVRWVPEAGLRVRPAGREQITGSTCSGHRHDARRVRRCGVACARPRHPRAGRLPSPHLPGRVLWFERPFKIEDRDEWILECRRLRSLYCCRSGPSNARGRNRGRMLAARAINDLSAGAATRLGGRGSRLPR